MLLPVDTAGRVLELIQILESVSTGMLLATVKVLLVNEIKMYFCEIKIKSMLHFAVLGRGESELSNILSNICCIQYD